MNTALKSMFLSFVLYGRKTEVSTLLKRYPALINAQDDYGMTAIDIAQLNDESTELTQLLEEAKENLEK
ncbi:MAG: hypothetical protein ACTSXV_01955 [Alphaproteobacteria bacterium]